MFCQEVNAVASNEEMPTFGSEGSADEGQNVDIAKRSFIPCEILSLIFSYVMVDVVDGEMIRKIGVLRELGSDFVEAIAENVKQLNVGSLLQGYKGNKSGYVSHLSNNIEQIVTIFPKLERVFLDGLSELKQSQLEYLLNNLSLKEISLKGCLLINQFTCSDFTQLEKITVDRENIALRSSLYKEIVHSVYIEKPQTLVKVPNGINCFLKTLAGASNELELSSRDTIHDVKMIFEGYSGIPADQQRMIFAGKRLADDRCLYDYGCINAGSTIHVVFRLRGGAGSNLSDIPNYNQIQFSPKEELNSSILYEHDEFKVLELDIFNGATCEILTKDILYEKRNNFDYNITPHLSNPFKKYLNTTVIPYLNNLRAFQRKIQEVQDIFVVHYSPQEDEDLILHTDPSYITLNICIHTSQDFGGNEIDLITQNEQQVSELVTEYGCGQDVDQNNNFTYRRVTPTIGKALVHLGSHPHKTLKITNGNRFNIVCWLK